MPTAFLYWICLSQSVCIFSSRLY